MTGWFLKVNIQVISLDYNNDTTYSLMSYPESNKIIYLVSV